jgi:single-stranded DNA-binding protein
LDRPYTQSVRRGEARRECHQHLGKGDLVSVQSDTFRVATWQSQDNSPQGQLEVTARRVDFIITKRGQATDTGSEEDVPF